MINKYAKYLKEVHRLKDALIPYYIKKGVQPFSRR
jgi:hypothetical protein